MRIKPQKQLFRHDPSLDDSGIVGPCDDGFYWVQYITRPVS